MHDPSICVTPQYLAEELLRSDGFSEMQHVEATDGFGAKLVAAGGADMMMEFAGVLPDPDRRGGTHRATWWRPHRLLRGVRRIVRSDHPRS